MSDEQDEADEGDEEGDADENQEEDDEDLQLSSCEESSSEEEEDEDIVIFSSKQGTVRPRKTPQGSLPRRSKGKRGKSGCSSRRGKPSLSGYLVKLPRPRLSVHSFPVTSPPPASALPPPRETPLRAEVTHLYPYVIHTHTHTYRKTLY